MLGTRNTYTFELSAKLLCGDTHWEKIPFEGWYECEVFELFKDEIFPFM